MKSWDASTGASLMVGLVAIALAVLAGDGLSQVTTTGSFRYPVRDAGTGRKTAEITGDSASETPEGGLRITGLRLAMLEIDEKTNAVVEASDCIYKLEDQMAVSDTDVRIVSGNLIVTGRGFTWRSKDGVMKIKSRARVEIGAALDLGSYMASPDK
ncbi:MAG: LPS export ABC transporter periplasmic protein LptC [bacterium]